MMNLFLVCFSCLFLLPGVLVALLNWADICIWVWEKWRNPRSKAETHIVPLLGGLCLSSGLFILSVGATGLLAPHLKALPAEPVIISALIGLSGLLIDYGSIPNLILTPLLGFVLQLRSRPAPGRNPRGPYCRELQLSFPLLLVGEDDIPRLIRNDSELPPKDADFLNEAPGSFLYADEKCQQIVRVYSPHKPNLWNRLSHRNDVAFWAAEVEYTTPRPYKPEKLVKLLARNIREDDDVWTQFHESRDLLRLLKTCTSFSELLALGSLAGWWENTTPGFGLPGLKEDDLTEEDIRQAAQHIEFTR